MTSAKIVQAARPLADGEDGRELHGGARGAARGRPSRRRPRAARCSRRRTRRSGERTGRGWEEWFDLLDEWGAAERTHRENARWLAEQQGLDPLAWNVQAVVGSYERVRGLREAGEHADGLLA